MNGLGVLQHSPAAERNGPAILVQLQALLPAQGRGREAVAILAPTDKALPPWPDIDTSWPAPA